VPIGEKSWLQGQFRVRSFFVRRLSFRAARSFIFVPFGLISLLPLSLWSPPSWPAKSHSALRYDTLTLSRTRLTGAKRRGERRGSGMWEKSVSLFSSRFRYSKMVGLFCLPSLPLILIEASKLPRKFIIEKKPCRRLALGHFGHDQVRK